MKETEILKACLQFLSAHGIFHWRSNQIPAPLPGGGFRRFVGLKGVSDILGMSPQGDGRLLAIECKTETGRVSEHQQVFLDRVTALGGVACVVRSVDELEADLKEAGVIS